MTTTRRFIILIAFSVAFGLVSYISGTEPCRIGACLLGAFLITFIQELFVFAFGE